MKIGDFDCEIAALAFDPKGQLYAISRDRNGEGTVVGSTLLKVDKGSAKYTKIGTGTGFKPSNLCSAAIDPKSGRMFSDDGSLAKQAASTKWTSRPERPRWSTLIPTMSKWSGL